MIEVLYDAIKAVAGQPIEITARVTDVEESVKDNCCFVLHLDGNMVSVEGTYLEDYDMWKFEIPASATVGYKGKHWYCIQHNGNNLCFMKPVYLT